MNSIKWLFIISGIAILHTQFPYEEGITEVYHFFPFNNDLEMSLRGYVWRIAIRITMLCYFYRELMREKPEYQQYMIWMVLIQLLIVLEFFLTYNSPWLILSKKPYIEIGLWHVLLIFIGGVYAKLKWKKYKEQQL